MQLRNTVHTLPDELTIVTAPKQLSSLLFEQTVPQKPKYETLMLNPVLLDRERLVHLPHLLLDSTEKTPLRSFAGYVLISRVQSINDVVSKQLPSSLIINITEFERHLIIHDLYKFPSESPIPPFLSQPLLTTIPLKVNQR